MDILRLITEILKIRSLIPFCYLESFICIFCEYLHDSTGDLILAVDHCQYLLFSLCAFPLRFIALGTSWLIIFFLLPFSRIRIAWT